MKATTTTTVKMNFPAYSPPSNVHVGPSRVSSPPIRSSSMREFHTVRGEMKEEGSRGAPMARPSTTHRSVSMSTQNLTDHQRHSDNQAYYPQQHHHVPNKPRRSQLFNEKSSSPGSGGGGSLAQQSGLSSSSASASSTGSGGSNTLEYPSKASSHSYSHSHSGYRTYPLRETSSLQTLPSSASSYGGSATTKSSHGVDGHPHHQNKHGLHHGGHHGQIRSASVRNIPSASGYNITTTTTTTAVSTASSSSSSGSSQQSGRPIFSQPISAKAGRVESVDIPSQPQQLSNTTSTAMATNMRHSDLSSGYPGHHHGHGRARHGSSSSTRGTSGQIQHGHGGSRGGENTKQSRRHLHKV